nr:hypothetical protein [Candidatus Freyarchaeota archaeon]
MKIEVDGHEIDIEFNLITLENKVFYDGKLVSEKLVSPIKLEHEFSVEENGQKVKYRVEISTKISSRDRLKMMVPIPKMPNVTTEIKVWRDKKMVYPQKK